MRKGAAGRPSLFSKFGWAVSWNAKRTATGCGTFSLSTIDRRALDLGLGRLEFSVAAGDRELGERLAVARFQAAADVIEA